MTAATELVAPPQRSTLQAVLWHSFSTGVGVALADRSALVARAWFYAVVTAVLGSMWRVAISVNGDSTATGTVAGYSAVAIFWYIATAEAALVPVPNNLIEQVTRRIVDESIEAWFSRPVFAGLPMVLFSFGHIVPGVVACAATGVGLSIAVVGAPVSTLALIVAAPALLLAVLLSIVLQHAIGTMAFWLGDISGLWLVYHRLVFLVGGLIIPLEALPEWLEPFARALPFMATVYVPGRLAAGHLELELVGRQLMWLAVFLVVLAVVDRRGEERMCRRGQ